MGSRQARTVKVCTVHRTFAKGRVSGIGVGDLRHSLVLVAVINRVKDLEIVKGKGWYRIPVKYAPERKPDYIAFYQTRVFGKEGRVIRCYASVKSFSVVKRLKLLPDEKGHPRAREYYRKFNLGAVRRTPRVLRNESRRRISFGFTTLAKLRESKRICQLFDIIPLEDMVCQALRKKGIGVVPEYCVMVGAR